IGHSRQQGPARQRQKLAVFSQSRAYFSKSVRAAVAVPAGAAARRPAGWRGRCHNLGSSSGLRTAPFLPAGHKRRRLGVTAHMSGNTIGKLFCVTNFGESHGPAIGCVVDGCPPGLALTEADIQAELDRRRPGTSRHVTQRREPDQVEILSGVYEGVTTGAPIGLLIRNSDARSKDYAAIADTFRPGHADYA